MKSPVFDSYLCSSVMLAYDAGHMNLKMSTSFLRQVVICGIVAISFGWLVGETTLYHIGSFDRAFADYFHNPTPQNEAALNVERNKIQHMREVDGAKAALLSFFLCNVVYSFLKRKLRLAAFGLVASCSTVLAYVGLPLSSGSTGGVFYSGFGYERVTERTIQIAALCALFVALGLFVSSIVYHHWRKTRLSSTA